MWKYKGLDIAFDADKGVFFHGALSATSFKALQKKMDAAGAFKPFTAMAYDMYSTTPEVFEIVGVRKPRGKWGKAHWVTSDKREKRNLLKDTPENRALLVELRNIYVEYAEKEGALRKQRGLDISSLEKRLDRVPDPEGA
jgi:hypothetical protein